MEWVVIAFSYDRIWTASSVSSRMRRLQFG